MTWLLMLVGSGTCGSWAAADVRLAVPAYAWRWAVGGSLLAVTETQSRMDEGADDCRNRGWLLDHDVTKKMLFHNAREDIWHGYKSWNWNIFSLTTLHLGVKSEPDHAGESRLVTHT